MSDDIIRPKINLKEQKTIKCEKCESAFFEPVFQIKKVSKLMTGSSEDSIVPFDTWRCADCKHVNKEFELFGEK